MPVIRTQVSVPTTRIQREALKTAYGKAITAVPGKTEDWLMCPFIDNTPIYFAGSDTQPAAFVEVNIKGKESRRDEPVWEKLARQITTALGTTLAIPADRIYVRFSATEEWGWNGDLL
ncbi:phenylpyruvate tautomerase MIF-related protein [Bifidobacterium bombi]|uniref:4-oxalocrotonate tautomerase n=1 Tax=Bifidobacterium bombi DSM 19703 TaxID=1341695 RepID=A0A080N4Q2_9BIFI|nr:phenylpyruvate tautomerase MIF-related protein [Bifidobacterium bombi]KFF31610.1 hypothetical protein BBOMB_0995 [Bifidobacterium bombi DSM 19703]